ncbi:MAG: Undecaprenyl phosphate N,N'-diacetylbacillosamine 1-phosphate transferase [candidate division WS2 bacterium]|nr:Undecaprenyl phosphate N,N'-diacetylbacillosamine 1-phosphate transferase [Candidatus Psychracetigena formicireducens]
MKVYPVLKRSLDVLLSTLAIVILSPVLLVVSLLIKCESTGPVLFKQRRIGRNKSEFYMFKFRTMRTDAPKDTPTHLLANPDIYITRVGKVLRKTSLDELPQIVNILCGTMSIIGPRPALWNQYDLIAERDKYSANDVPPGLTGWAQINGRDELPIEVKAKLDGEYVARMSFMFDVKCFFGTIVSVLKRDGVIEGGTGTTSKATAAITPNNKSRETVTK